MGRLPLCCAVVALLAVGAAAARAETVRLKNGNILTGDVLVQKTDVVVLDVGYAVLEVPREQIAAIEEGTADETQRAAAAEEGTLYLTAELKPRTVRELVEEFGSGLVKVQTPSAIGSGLIINHEGYVITNAHVIQGETQVSCILFIREGQSLARREVKDVEIVAVNPAVDLALLKVKKPDDVELTPLYFGDMDRVRTGEPVFAIGNPFGMERSVSEGIVSHKARQIAGMLLIQTTAPINPGNSGGPLLNMRGEVIGVTNMKIGYFAEGMGFAVPINYVCDFLKFREAYAYDEDNPNTGYHYLEPPHVGEKGEQDDEEPQDTGEGKQA